MEGLVAGFDAFVEHHLRFLPADVRGTCKPRRGYPREESSLVGESCVAQGMERHNCDVWRRERFYTCYFEPAAKRWMPAVHELFNASVGVKPHSTQRATEMHLEEFVTMLERLELLNEDFTRREAVACFIWSRLIIVDELQQRDKFITLNYWGTAGALTSPAGHVLTPSSVALLPCCLCQTSLRPWRALQTGVHCPHSRTWILLACPTPLHWQKRLPQGSCRL